MVNFKYRIHESLIPLIQKDIMNYNNNFLIGYLEEGSDLRYSGLYLVCEIKRMQNIDIRLNPIAVVARNESEEIRIYQEITEINDCTVICELERRCDALKVETLDEHDIY